MAEINTTLYRFHLTHLLSTYEAHPYGLEGWDIDARRQGDSKFMQRLLTGKFIFMNVPKRGWFDYDWIKAIEDGSSSCAKISVRVDRSCDGGATYSPFWSGKFTTADGEFNLDKCRFTTDFEPNDIYQCVTDGMNDEFNIISLPNEYEVINTGTQSSLEFSASPTGPNWTFLALYTGCNPDVPSIGISWREYKWTNCVAGNPVMPAGAGWALDTNDCGTTNQSKWARVPLDVAPSPNLDFLCGTCDGNGNAVPPDTLCRYTLVLNLCGVSSSSVWWCRPDPAPVDNYTHNRTLGDVLLGVTQTACSSITSVASDFFEINPVGDAPGYAPGINYVTGTASQVMDLMISQKSDILLPAATEPATVGNITFSQLTNYLESEFLVYWWIDGTVLRLEHEKYFTYTTLADFTVAPYSRQLSGTNIYSRIQDKRPRREKYKWMEAFNPDFVGADIVYDFDCVKKAVGVPRGGREDEFIDNSVTHSVDKITTDIDFIVASPSDISKEGFVMLSTSPDGLGSYVINSEVGLISGNFVPNGHLSWANLHYNYHRYARVLISGTMNNIPETFITAKPTKQQDKVMINDCCGGVDDSVASDDIPGLIKTGLGFGVIDSYKKNLKNNATTFKLLHQ